jgi:tetratricopeptide (TPR) repeat protein
MIDSTGSPSAMAFSPTPSRLKALLLASLTAAALTLPFSRAAAQDQQQPPQPPQLSDYTADQVNEFLRPALDAKDWAKALTVLDRIKAKAAPDSYDAALADGLIAQTDLQKNELQGALTALMGCVAITDRHPNLYFLASVYYALGQGAESGGKQTTDKPMMEKALYWINRGLESAIRPREAFYQLKISALYQLNRLEKGAEYLELGLQSKPDNKSYWQQLAYSYVQLADDAQKKHDSQSYFEYTVRAILTMERAQEHGFLNTPKDNYQIVGMFFNINQFGKACDVLSKGLRDGGIESTVQNWQLLAYSYQQEHRDKDAIKTLEEAARIFPKSGQLEYQIAQTYYGNNQVKEAFVHIKKCVEKGGPEKPGDGWYFYAVIAYNLKDYNAALKAAAQAAKYPDTAKEAKRIEQGVKASIQDQKNRAASAAAGVIAD